MKKYDISFLVVGVLLSLLPIYNFFGWIYVWNTHSSLGHMEKVSVVREDILFGLFEGRYSSSFFLFGFGFTSGILLLLSLLNSIQYGAKFKTVKLFFLVLNLIFSFWILWGMM